MSLFRSGSLLTHAPWRTRHGEHPLRSKVSALSPNAYVISGKLDSRPCGAFVSREEGVKNAWNKLQGLVPVLGAV